MSDLSPLCAQTRTSLRPKLSTPCQLPPPPMRVLPVGVEHPLDVTVQRPQHSDPRMHQEVAALGGTDQAQAMAVAAGSARPSADS